MKAKAIDNKEVTIALAGNPNSGKTSLFNALTGSRQHVGNWPGVTVEKKEGSLVHNGASIKIVDLPGTYSLTAFSMEEIISRNYIVDCKPEVVVDVIDASNLERNLYLALQIIELGTTKTIIALNMIDVAKSMGHKINVDLLSELLGVPVVPTIARTEKGMKELLDTALAVADGGGNKKEIKISYGKEIEDEIARLEAEIERSAVKCEGFSPRWLAVKLLENDLKIRKHTGSIDNGAQLLAESDRSRDHISSLFRQDAELVIADMRYGFISGLIREVLVKPAENVRTATDRIDGILMNRILGAPLFALFMYIAFTLTFTLGDPPMQWLEAAFERLGGFISVSMPGESLLESLIVDGVIGGVGGVVMFLPNIILLFLAISILEDTGYMARVAFIMDRAMHFMGLHGKSFIPMLVGMGCSVPAVMATRTLENWKDRIATILIVPLASCGARLPVYILLAGAFFPGKTSWGLSSAGIVVFAMYLTGILLAAGMARLFRSTILRGPDAPFVMELPPYRLPTAKSVVIHIWERAWMYVKKAGTIILALTAIIWFSMTFPTSYPGMKNDEAKLSAAVATADAKWAEIESAGVPEAGGADYDAVYSKARAIEGAMAAAKLENSFAGKFGKFFEPVFRPIGFDWKISIALISGLAAKEVVVSTLGTIYSIVDADKGGEASLRQAMINDQQMNPLKAVVLMLFVLISVPCVATLAIIKKETNSWRWPIFSVAYHMALAWGICFLVYRIGMTFGVGVG